MSLYQTWKDLVTNEPQDQDAGISAADSAASGNEKIALTAEGLRELGAQKELIDLFEEKEQLEKQLHIFAGKAEPDPEDERRKMCFPVKVHTKESRIEERRLRLHDERMTMLKKRQQAKAALDKKKTEKELQAIREANNKRIIRRKKEKEEQELRNKALQAAILIRKDTIKREEIHEQNRTKAACERRLIFLRHRQKRERADELIRRSRERRILETRWQHQRQRALADYAQARKQNEMVDQQRHEQIVQAAIERMVQKRQEAGQLERQEDDRRTSMRIASANILIRERKEAKAFERERERSKDRARDSLRRKCANDSMVKRRLDQRSMGKR